jgi:hypothetical protein
MTISDIMTFTIVKNCTKLTRDMTYKQAVKVLHKTGVMPTYCQTFPIIAGMEFLFV